MTARIAARVDLYHFCLVRFQRAALIFQRREFPLKPHEFVKQLGIVRRAQLYLQRRAIFFYGKEIAANFLRLRVLIIYHVRITFKLRQILNHGVRSFKIVDAAQVAVDVLEYRRNLQVDNFKRAIQQRANFPPRVLFHI